MQNFNIKNNEKSFTIRLDFIILTLEVLKLQGLINISWFTLLALLVVPWAIGKLFVMYIQKKIKQISKGGTRDTVPPISKSNKKENL
jgi:hypothetical protein